MVDYCFRIVLAHCHFCIYLFSDVLKVDVWSQIPTLKDPELRRRAESLPQTVLGYTASSTVMSYSSAWRRWKEWAGAKDGAAAIPAQPVVVVLYFRDLMEQAELKHNSSQSLAMRITAFRDTSALAVIAC